MTDHWLVELGYLIGAVLFILALKLLNSPKTARRGNWLAALGMAIALGTVGFSLGEVETRNYIFIAIAVAAGTIIGSISAKRVQMTAMPQMVALFNGVGGGAVALVAMIEFMASGNERLLPVPLVTAVLSAIIGSISFSGSMIAYGKLQELMPGKPILYPGDKVVTALVLMTVIALAVLPIAGSTSVALFAALIGLATILGILMVLPIGGADMPVVISLLNSFTGLAAGLAGFVLGNTALLIGGGLVGASGLILTLQMCSAMNRSLENVLFGAFGAAKSEGGEGTTAKGRMRSYSVEDAAIIFASARSVIIVPGYGLAVAQAQHVVKELTEKLEERGIQVKFAIHPVAGRMPGHMNVLLAEADISYDHLFDLEEINSEFPETDVALVIGANDVVNPAARTDKSSPIYGMPILDVDKAKTVIVSKRGMGAGFAGIENELFLRENTVMVFGDAKSTMTKLVAALDDF
ncbi:MAG: NAD(P)(+) transhydrogenase (Re/Si-specific) subunit beta [Fimbriimonadales bacterium]|nr:NAD(P)(+) transhydrogenase (Re/Si-specific) subunit beta [Fimbriimonadales bacterium]